MAIYYVISTTSSDTADVAYMDKEIAKHRFNDIASTGQFVRLIACNGDQSFEVDRRNAPRFPIISN